MHRNCFNLEETPEQWDTRFSMLEFYCIKRFLLASLTSKVTASPGIGTPSQLAIRKNTSSVDHHICDHRKSHSTCDQCGFWLWTFIAAQCSPPPFTMKPYPPQGTSNLGLFTFSTRKASCNNLFQHLSTRTMYQNI